MKFFIPALAIGTLCVACGPTDPRPFDEISAKHGCEGTIKQTIRDPDSYRFEEATVTSTSGKYKEYGEALVKFRSKNGFGGYVSGMATCKRYNKNGEAWYQSKIIS